MEESRLKLKAELAAHIFDTLMKYDENKTKEYITDRVVRLTNGIIKGIEDEKGYTVVHGKDA